MRGKKLADITTDNQSGYKTEAAASASTIDDQCLTSANEHNLANSPF